MSLSNRLEKRTRCHHFQGYSAPRRVANKMRSFVFCSRVDAEWATSLVSRGVCHRWAARKFAHKERRNRIPQAFNIFRICRVCATHARPVLQLRNNSALNELRRGHSKPTMTLVPVQLSLILSKLCVPPRIAKLFRMNENGLSWREILDAAALAQLKHL